MTFKKNIGRKVHAVSKRIDTFCVFLYDASERRHATTKPLSLNSECFHMQRLRNLVGIKVK